jgi:hypothetical protein
MRPGCQNDAEFFPGLSKSWTLTFMVKTKRHRLGAQGALGCAGLANLFYWIDRQNGFGGFWATQILPFGDPVSFTGYMDFETAFYKNLRRRGGSSRSGPDHSRCMITREYARLVSSRVLISRDGLESLTEIRFAADSLLQGDGFELSVPRPLFVHAGGLISSGTNGS